MPNQDLIKSDWIEPATPPRIGVKLNRPECVLCTEAGDFFTAHQGAGVLHIAPSGQQNIIGHYSEIEGQMWLPNGIALQADGSFLIANIGPGGGVWRLQKDGKLEPFLREVDGKLLVATNFVLVDAIGRIWVTISTETKPIISTFTAYGAPEIRDGYVILIDGKGARIVADGLAFTNEVRLDREGRFLYVIETMGRRVTRFRVDGAGDLSQRETFTSFGPGTFPDGFDIDTEGHLWVTSILSNRLFRVAPDGTQTLLLEDCDQAQVDAMEQTIADRKLVPGAFQKIAGRLLNNMSSVTFGGRDLRTIYLGSLGTDTLPAFRAKVAGLPPSHWKLRF